MCQEIWVKRVPELKPSQRETAREFYFTACSDRSLDFDYAVRYGIHPLDNESWVAGWKEKARKMVFGHCRSYFW